METEVRKPIDVEGGSSASSSSSSPNEYYLPCAAAATATATGSEQVEEPYNVFRESSLRYMGYANEIGESFRYQFPRFVVPSYVLSFGYCGMDAATTGYRVWAKSKALGTSASKTAEKEAAMATFDTLLWQSLASVMIPGAFINMIVKAARFGVARTPSTVLPAAAAKWLPTFAGIGSIPIIVHPIDNAVDFALDNTTRAWFKYKP